MDDYAIEKIMYLNVSLDSASLPYVRCKSDLRRTSFRSTEKQKKYLNTSLNTMLNRIVCFGHRTD